MSPLTIQHHKAQIHYFTEDLGNDLTLDLVLIPGGTFQIGQTEAEKAELIRLVGEQGYQSYYTRELPRHSVKVPPFFMGCTPITQAQWQQVVKGHKTLKPKPFYFKGMDLPVEGVSWDDAIEFCRVLSKRTRRDYRLPSEAEWEYACRAGTTTPFHTGETISPDLANYDGNQTYGDGARGEYREQTMPVQTFPANAFGLYDMHGNVLEWCQDHRHDSYEGAPSDGSAWLTNNEKASRILRGGSWIDDPRKCRSASRDHYPRGYRDYDVGFRVVCSAPRTL